MLTNHKTIRSRIEKLKKIEKMIEDGTMALLPKKEQAKLMKEKAELDANFGGIREMKGIPDAMFVVDPALPVQLTRNGPLATLYSTKLIN